MTAFPGAGDAVDRVGGRLALETIVREKVGATGSVDLEVEESSRLFSLNLTTGDGRFLAELRTVEVARSNALRSDQMDLLASDIRELRRVIAEIVAQLAEEAIPELEKRALDGDR